MKNLKISVIALFFGAAFLVSSCGPSLCDCVEEGYKEKPDMDKLEKCADVLKDAKEEDIMKCLEKEEEKTEE
jgi:hypothetical protein